MYDGVYIYFSKCTGADLIFIGYGTMTTFLFWNVNKKPLTSLIAALAQEHSVDVLILAECDITPSTLLYALNQSNVSYSYAPGIGCRKIEIYTKFSSEFLPPIWESDRLTIRHLALPGSTSILVAATHFISKAQWDKESQFAECQRLATDIIQAEKQVNHTRTILVGDLNMNPFESGVVAARGLHAVMSQEIALRKKRTVQGIDYPIFYNPM